MVFAFFPSRHPASPPPGRSHQLASPSKPTVSQVSSVVSFSRAFLEELWLVGTQDDVCIS